MGGMTPGVAGHSRDNTRHYTAHCYSPHSTLDTAHTTQIMGFPEYREPLLTHDGLAHDRALNHPPVVYPLAHHAHNMVSTLLCNFILDHLYLLFYCSHFYIFPPFYTIVGRERILGMCCIVSTEDGDTCLQNENINIKICWYRCFLLLAWVTMI